jgi:hypothetical protein
MNAKIVDCDVTWEFNGYSTLTWRDEKGDGWFYDFYVHPLEGFVEWCKSNGTLVFTLVETFNVHGNWYVLHRRQDGTEDDAPPKDLLPLAETLRWHFEAWGLYEREKRQREVSGG